MTRKDAKTGRAILEGLVAAGKPARPADGTLPQARPSGAVKAMGLGLDRLSAEASEARALKQELSRRETTQEIDANLFNPSPVADRIPLNNDPRTLALREAIEVNGQQIPVIARPHPTESGRFEIAAGHRRWKVAQELERPLKAIIRKLSDQDMVILQGQENGPREDLTFVERARFALQMEERGFERDTLCAALSVDRPEISRLLTVAQSIGEELILKIGPAPKVGRPRWLQFAKGMERPGARAKIEELVRAQVFRDADSDTRFLMALNLLATTGRTAKKRVFASTSVAWIERKGQTTRLVLESADFASFLEKRLPDLLREFDESSEAQAKSRAEGVTH